MGGPLRASPLLLASLTAVGLAGCRDLLSTDPPCLPAFSLDADPYARELVVHVLDVGQGDANVIINGRSVVIIDGGRTASRFGELLDSLDLNGSSVLAVILSHGHSDHASGLKEVFQRSRDLKVDYYFDNKDVTTNSSVQTVRDSADARAARGELVYRDADDPCGDGSPICTLVLDGGARLHVMRPMPDAASPDDRSTPVKLVGPDSASFSMWFAGDARYGASEWFERGAAYHLHPG